eukprot:gene18955-20861_t
MASCNNRRHSCLRCLFFLLCFAISHHEASQKESSFKVEVDKTVSVPQGRSLQLNHSHFGFNATKECLLCRVEVILDPICLRFGNISSTKFSCDFNEESVSYDHYGSPISNEDCVKFKFFLFYKDKTENEIVKLKLKIIDKEKDEQLSRSRFDVTEIGGTVRFDRDILPNAARSNLNNCDVIFREDKIWPASGRLMSNPGTQPISCSSFNAIYKHDASHTPNLDYIPFEIRLRKSSGKRKKIVVLRYHLKIRILPAQTKSPPYIYSRFSRIVVKQYGLKQMLASNMRVVDFKARPENLLLTVSTTKKNDLGGFFATMDRPDQPLEGITQQQVNQKNIIFVSPKKLLAKTSRSSTIQQMHLRAVDVYGTVSKRKLRMMFFVRKFVANYLTVVINSPIHVLEGQSYTISSLNLDIACKSLKCNGVKFAVWSGPQYGQLLKDSQQINLFTMEDILKKRLVYKHDGSETLSDGIVLTISDKYQFAYATLGIVVEPLDDSAPFLSVNKPIVTGNGRRTRIETDSLKASDPDTPIDRIEFHIKQKPRKGDIVRMSTGRKYEIVNKFYEIELENGVIYYATNSQHPTTDNFTYILSDGGKKPNLSKEYTSMIKIQATDKSPPYKADSSDCLVMINETTRSLSLNFLLYKDATSSSSEIVFTLKEDVASTKKEDLIQLQDIFKLNQHEKVSVKDFTQMEVFHNKIFFLNTYNEIGRQTKTLYLKFIVTDKDGYSTGLQTCKVMIKPVDNLPPQITLARSLRVLEGNRMRLDSKTLILNDTDTYLGALRLRLTSQPKHGRIIFKGKELKSGAWIAYKDMTSNALYYAHNDDENTKDAFVIVVSDGKQSTQKELLIHITPVNDQRPMFTKDNTRVSVMEASSVVLDLKLFKVIDADTDVKNLSFHVITAPSKGHVIVQRHRVDKFTYDDLKNGLVTYSHKQTEIGPYATTDLAKISVCDLSPFDSANCSSVLNLSFDIIPINSRPPKLTAKQSLLVEEGSRVLLDDKSLLCSDEDTIPDEIEIQILKFPQFGFIENIAPSEGSEESNAGKRISAFKYSDLKSKTIYYVQHNHTGIEPREDSVSFMAYDGVFQSSDVGLKINISATSDEEPRIETDVVKVHEGGWKIIGSDVIRITDKDIPKERLLFFVEEFPKHGQMLYRCNGAFPGLKILKIGQRLYYNRCALVYGHDDSESRSDQISLVATDRKKAVRAVVKIDIIAVNDQKPTVVKNFTMMVRAGALKNITRSYLETRDLDTPDELIRYRIRSLAMYGALKKYDVTTRNYTHLIVNSTFTQSDVNENLISYTNILLPLNGFRDSFGLEVTDGAHVIKALQFYLRIKVSCRKYLRITTNDVRADNPSINVTNVNLHVETRPRGNARKINAISYQVIKPPSRGLLIVAGKQQKSNVISFSQDDLNDNKVEYRPSKYPLRRNDSFKFFVTDGKCLQRGKMNIIATNTKTIKLLDRNAPLNVKKQGVTTITPLELRADEQYSSKNVVYLVTKAPKNGVLVKGRENATRFTQEDINELSLGYRLVNRQEMKDTFDAKILLLDKARKLDVSIYEEFTFNIGINLPKRQKPRVITNQAITSLEYLSPNVLGSVITNQNLLSYDCLSLQDPNLAYTVIEPPIHGELFHKETGKAVAKFTQKDVNEGVIIYKLTDKRMLSYDDKIFLDVSSDGCENMKNIEFSIHWSVITLSDDIVVKCLPRKTELIINMKRNGYIKQGSAFEVHMESVGDEKRSFQPIRIWFYPNEVTKQWTLPDDVLEYELINVQLKNEFNTLLGKKKSIVVDVSKGIDSCSKKPGGTTKQKAQHNNPEQNTTTSQGSQTTTLHAIKLVKPASGSLIRKEKKHNSRSCEPDWILFETNCYKLFQIKGNLRKATKTCRSSGSLVYAPASTSEEAHVNNVYKGVVIWLGIKQNKRGRWKWTVKSREKEMSKKLERITKSTNVASKCIFSNSQGNWQAVDCKSKQLAFVCKKKNS